MFTKPQTFYQKDTGTDLKMYINKTIVENFKYKACDKEALQSFYEIFKDTEKVYASDLLKQDFVRIFHLCWIHNNGYEIVDADFKKACEEIAFTMLDYLPHPMVDSFKEAYKLGNDLGMYADIFYKMRSLFADSKFEGIVGVAEILSTNTDDEYSIHWYNDFCNKHLKFNDNAHQLHKDILLKYLK